ncbi:histidinol-phosphate aminotransferase [Pholiota conissans]|uniref:histidinol-phosphate transaminase n=1 Tax=Pholiota conissans TaxID=109636 RepID=A0A9P5YW67_9AGAR|nr:histidinol-phosphate aminotransferase [Pholiota conissans]
MATVYPAHFDISAVIRPNILALQPYRCARDDYSEGILLDANENAFGSSIIASDDAEKLLTELQATTSLDLHRYPDPSHPSIKGRIASLRGLVPPPGTTTSDPSGADHVFLGVGSDEIIDLLMRVCVKPGGLEKILTTPPTYGMYAVCAQVNDVGVVKVPLELTGTNGEGGEKGRFSVNVDEIKKIVAADPSIKLIFLCSPGNPTGTLIPLSSIRELLEYPLFKGIVVVDEAYIDFADDVQKSSAASLVKEYSNIVVMQTLSKSFGLAAIRLGIALAQPPLIQILSNTKAPYNISTPTAHLALSALSPGSVSLMQSKVRSLVQGRSTLLKGLASLSSFGVGPSIGGNDANFVVVPILEKPASEAEALNGKPDNKRAFRLYKTLAETHAVVVRFRGNEPGCDACLRITVGTEEENAEVLKKMKEVLAEI